MQTIVVILMNEVKKSSIDVFTLVQAVLIGLFLMIVLFWLIAKTISFGKEDVYAQDYERWHKMQASL
jgi:hypothetical protein